MRFAETSSSVKNINLSLIKARNEPEKSSRLGVLNLYLKNITHLDTDFCLGLQNSIILKNNRQTSESHQINDKSKNFWFSKATNLWQFYALSILLHHSGIVIFDDYPFPPFFRPFFLFQRPAENLFSFEVFLKDHTARRMTKVLWDSWVISHVSNAREIRQYIGSRCVMCWRLDHYHHQLRIFTLWSFVTDLQQ